MPTLPFTIDAELLLECKLLSLAATDMLLRWRKHPQPIRVPDAIRIKLTISTNRNGLTHKKK